MKVKLAGYEVNLSFKGSEVSVKNINGDVSSKDKIKRLAGFVKSWCDVNNRPCTRVTVHY